MYSTDDTFKKLKRSVDYSGACFVYASACEKLHPGVPRQILDETAEPELNKVGWTVQELFDEAEKRAQNSYEGKYG
jgi:hypothetical protein